MKRIPAMAALAAAFQNSVAALNWNLPPEATLDGDILTIDVPDGGGEKRCCASAPIDLSDFDGIPFEAEIEAWGECVGKARDPWNGLKFQFQYDDADSGETRYLNTHPLVGDFPRRTLSVRDANCVRRRSPVQLQLGLQDAGGRVFFDLSTLRVRPGRLYWPVTNQTHRCAYGAPVRMSTTDNRGAPATRSLRGVMSPTRDMTEDDFRTLAEWGATLLRYQMTRPDPAPEARLDISAYDDWLEQRLDHFDEVVLPLAQQYGINVVLDLHSVPGGNEGRANAFEMAMFHDAVCAEHFISLWRGIALRFKGRDSIYGYDLVNEPVQRREALPDCDWWSLQRRAAEAIREIDPVVPVIIEANLMDHPESFGMMSQLALTNAIYEVHVYNPVEYTHHGVASAPAANPPAYPDNGRGWNADFLRRVLSPVREFQNRHGAKIYVGEFSAIAWVPGAENYLRDLIGIFNEYGWDWTYHAFRESPVWDVEKAGASRPEIVPDPDTPRKRALLDGFAQ